MALRELKTYRANRQKADEHRIDKLFEQSFGKWSIYKLSQTKLRLNYNLAYHFREQTLMRKLFTHIRVSNQIFSRVYATDKIALIYEQNLLNKCYQTLIQFKNYNQYKFNHLP